MTADRSFLDLITAATGAGWRVVEPHDDEPWIEVSPPDARLPSQGWKLHVSATVGDATGVLEKALPVLIKEGAVFKVVASPELLEALNAAEGGVGQIGKFIAVYPPEDRAAVHIGVALDETTTGLRGPPVPSDRPLRPGSLVHYRYGSFEERMALDPWGRPVPVIVDPAGEAVPDPREETYVQPPWVEDPFVAAGVAVEPSREAIGGRFALVSTLHRSPRGAVHLAADLETSKPCVLKQAWRDAAVGPDGRDAADHLRWEAAALERLGPDPRFPALIELVEHNGDLYLAMERVEGPTLARRVAAARARGGFVPPAQLIAWGRELAAALGVLHAAGLAYRDLTSTNVVIGERLRLVDLEHAAELGSTDAPPGGTSGYASPEQASGAPPSVADDVYSLGAILYLLCTGAEPPEAPDPFALLGRPVRLLNPSIGGPLADVVARCLDPDPAARYASVAEVGKALERSSAGAAVAPPEAGTGDPADPSRATNLARTAGDALCELLEAPRVRSGETAAAVLALSEVAGGFADSRHAETLGRVAGALAAADRADHPGGLLSGEGLNVAAMLAAARALNDDALREAAASRARSLAKLPPAGPDLSSGLAGRLRAHLLVLGETGDPAARDAAGEAGDRLLATAEDGPRWPLPEFAGRPGPVHLGWAHGLAGIADALLDLHISVGHDRGREAAETAVRRLDAAALPALDDESGAMWPDLEGGPPGGPSLWRGAAGVTRFLLHAAAAGIPGAAGLADRGARAVARGGRWAGPTLALGLAGTITLLLDAAELDPKWRSEAVVHARLLEAFAEDGGRRWRGLPDPLDLAVGLPGVAVALARLAADRPDPLGLPLVRFTDRGPRWAARTTKG